jgi:hypothetical protein
VAVSSAIQYKGEAYQGRCDGSSVSKDHEKKESTISHKNVFFYKQSQLLYVVPSNFPETLLHL